MKLPFKLKKGHLWVFVVVTLVLAYIGYGEYDSWRTERKFANIEHSIDSLKEELKKQGISEISKNKYCLRDGEKFGGGQLRCEIRISWLIEGDDPQLDVLTTIKKSMGITEVLSSNIDGKTGTIQYIGIQKSNCYLLKSGESSGINYDFYCIVAVNKAIYPVNE